MKCDYVKSGDITAIVCSGGRRRKEPKCIKCGRLSTRQCDWNSGPTGRCDRFLCSLCTHSPSKGKDLCPDHTEAWASHPANPLNKKSE